VRWLSIPSAAPWGAKVTIVTYIKGFGPNVEEAIEVATKALDPLPGVVFVGASVSIVDDEPKDQGGS
jgi:hypothetical protein